MDRLTKATLKSGLEQIAGNDEHMAAAIEEHGYPELRQREPGFEALLRAIVGQQLSIAAAGAIWKRLEDAVSPLTPQALMTQSETALRALGFSRQKIAYAKGLASDVRMGRVDLGGLSAMANDTAVAELVKIKGIGRWSAEIYLLFALGRADVFPVDDLALLIETQRVKGLKKRPDRKKMIRIAEAWRPWRGAAAHLLWHTYGRAKTEIDGRAKG
ncbi:MAG: DNA-3-methyladenine glycosylase family protein [Alphaproteobacteria bacterium]